MTGRMKTLGVALAATLALAGLGGASSASGATLCNAAMSPCPAANIVAAPFHIDARSLGTPQLVLGANTVVCNSSAITDRILLNPATPIPDAVITWTFTGCAIPAMGIGCTVIANPSPPPLGWPTRISTPGTVWGGSQGDFAVDAFNVTVQCGGFPPCQVTGAIGGAAQTIVGGWFNPGVPSPPKPAATARAELAFSSAVTGAGGLCAPGTFRAIYEVTQAPFPGANLWLV